MATELILMGWNVPNEDAYQTRTTSQRIHEFADSLQMPAAMRTFDNKEAALILLIMKEAAQGIVNAVHQHRYVDSTGGTISPDRVQTELEILADDLAKIATVFRAVWAPCEGQTDWPPNVVLWDTQINMQESIEELDTYANTFKTTVLDA
ncbi:MAG: hypothetical protein KGR16_04045 [Verrucomicrobia bacterium]|nr:hypothetical protein [Verrucomicrobiota bacterium]MDE3047181.1 hypothetical protein [Verrucomicrobiota bacterium]